MCWWCEKGRQSREHFFKECTAWTKEIRELWTAVGEASGRRERAEDRFKGRRGFGYRVKQARARPSNTSIRDLLSNDRYTETALSFLGATRVGEVKEGAICKYRLGVPLGLGRGQDLFILSYFGRGESTGIVFVSRWGCHKPWVWI